MTPMPRIPLPFSSPFPVVGMVHLAPLPGSPGWEGSMDRVVDRAMEDALALLQGGVDGILVENYGDTPFHPSGVGPETVASMTRVVADICRHTPVPLGINVLRNDAAAALGIALATGASFIRVNVHVGTMFTDQGRLDGSAHETLRRRHALGGMATGVAILADVLVKHAVPPWGVTAGSQAQDLWHRGGADALLVTGRATGQATPLADLKEVAMAVPGAPVWVASGVTPEEVEALLSAGACGAIVGSAFQRHGMAGAGVEGRRVSQFMEAVGQARESHSARSR